MTFARRGAASIAILALSLAGATAQAEPTAEDLASARALFKEGRALREQGDLPKALEKLRAAHALGQTPITGFELARTYVALGKLVDGYEVSLGVARLPVAGDETGRSDVARIEAAKLATSLEPRLATLMVTVKGLTAGSFTRVSVDGETIPPAAIGEPRRADPGSHLAVLALANGAEVRLQVDVKEGESRAVILDAAPALTGAAPAVPVEASPPPPPHRSNAIVIAGASVAGVGLLFGASFGVATFVTRGALQGDCPGGRCGPTYHDELARAQTQATAATVSFIVAGVGAGAVVLDLLFRKKPAAQTATASAAWSITPEIGPGWVGVHGAF